MPKCAWCGREFDVSRTRRICGQRYGANVYDDTYPDADICEKCAEDELGAAVGAGAALKELMHYDDD